MKEWAISGCVFLAMAVAAVGEEPASAREPREIFASVLKDYKTITEARKKLRRKEKKGQPLTGDEYYVMAYACGYEEPESASIILTALSRSKCKDRITDYYLEAGRRGTPEGFLAAARRETNVHDAFGFAQLAYQLSGEDAALRNEALELMADLKPRVPNLALANQQATQISQQLVAGGRYASLRDPAGMQELANVLPNLKWLDFKDPKRCTWSKQASAVIGGSYGFNDKLNYPTVSAKVAVPGFDRPITSRIVRPGVLNSNEIDVYVDFKGRWNGLTVLGLRYSFLEESDGYQATGIRFAEPVRTVAARLGATGFVVNADGSTREQVSKRDSYGNIDGVITSVTSKNGETLFLCDEVFYASYGEP